MDGRKNNGGARTGAGNKGYGKLEFVKNKVEQHSELWWTEWEAMMKEGKPEDKRFAMTEFNKIQIKMIPQTLAGDKDNPIEVNLKIKGKDKEKIDKAISNL